MIIHLPISPRIKEIMELDEKLTITQRWITFISIGGCQHEPYCNSSRSFYCQLYLQSKLVQKKLLSLSKLLMDQSTSQHQLENQINWVHIKYTPFPFISDYRGKLFSSINIFRIIIYYVFFKEILQIIFRLIKSIF